MAHVEDDELLVRRGAVTNVSGRGGSNAQTQEAANTIEDARLFNYGVRHGMAESVASDIHSTDAGQTSNEANRIIGGSPEDIDSPEESEDFLDLGLMAPFAISARATVTNTGSSVVTGNLGLNPGSSVTGMGGAPGVLNGTQVIGSGHAAAQADLLAAWTDAIGRPFTAIGADLASTTLTPGVYFASSSLTISAGSLTLDGGGDPDAGFIIRAGTTFGTASGVSVLLTNGTQAKNVNFLAGTSITLGTSSVVKGNLIAAVSITGTTSATNTAGRLLAGAAGNDAGAVTLDTNIVSIPV